MLLVAAGGLLVRRRAHAGGLARSRKRAASPHPRSSGWLAEPVLGADGPALQGGVDPPRLLPELHQLAHRSPPAWSTVSLTVGTLAGYALARTKIEPRLLAPDHRPDLPRPAALGPGDGLSCRPSLTRRETPASRSGTRRSSARSSACSPPRRRPSTASRWAVIAVLVAINQPFTIWMLRSFFQNVPAELDEAARVDGCSHFEAFRRVIMPVMWPGVITTGLFSFLLAYNDYLVCALLLDAQSQTMVPAITPVLQPRDHRHRPDRGGRGRRFDHRAAVPPGDGLPAADRVRPHGRRGERVTVDEGFESGAGGADAGQRPSRRRRKRAASSRAWSTG